MSRPKAFDVGQAVSDALEVFIAKGYEGATLSELTSAMGINASSLYAAFESKMGLFRQAMELYACRRGPILDKAISKAIAYDVAASLLRDYGDALTDPDMARGCLYVQGALSCSDDSLDIRQELADRRLAIEPVLAARFSKAIAEGDLPSTSDPQAIARYIATLLQGMAVQASGGTSREKLHAMVDMVLQCWPKAEGNRTEGNRVGRDRERSRQLRRASTSSRQRRG